MTNANDDKHRQVRLGTSTTTDKPASAELHMVRSHSTPRATWKLSHSMRGDGGSTKKVKRRAPCCHECARITVLSHFPGGVRSDMGTVVNCSNSAAYLRTTEPVTTPPTPPMPADTAPHTHGNALAEFFVRDVPDRHEGNSDRRIGQQRLTPVLERACSSTR